MFAVSQAAAQTSILLALRAQDWSLAQSLAAAEPDPLARKLVTFIRLLNPTQARAAELAAFLADNPGWPDRSTLERRYGEALTDVADARETAALCLSHTPQSAAALLHCAEAYAVRGNQTGATQAARTAWTTGLTHPDQEAEFSARWGHLPTQAEQSARFDMLERTDQSGASRQVARLAPPLRALATARLALRRDDPNALASLVDVPTGLRDNPALLLAEARFLRRRHADAAALALWRTALPAAESAIAQGQRSPFWTERDALARNLLVDGDFSGAYGLANDALLAPDQAIEATFLAGWIALQRLHDPGMARARFQTLEGLSHTAIARARALYWLGRASAGAATSQTFYARAAAWPFTFYGQAAARATQISDEALSARIAAQKDPTASDQEAAAFALSEAARAATILAGWGDPRRAADFLTQAILPPATFSTRSLAASFALHLHLPDVAVQAARLAGRDGGVLAVAGWPAPYTPPPESIPSALILGVMRQESSFDPAIVSAAGAHGLMQLMQPTANQIAGTLHVPAGPLADPDINMRLGAAYLGKLLNQFARCLPCAIAAYNAGPRRVREWVNANGSPAPGDATIDWIELIPFAETRNYVERVIENETVYAATGH